MNIIDTQNNFFQIYKRNFQREERKLGLRLGQIIALPAKIRHWLIQLYLAYTIDNKMIIYRFKRGFFCGVCIEKVVRSFVGENFKEIGRNCNLCGYGSI